MAYVSNDADDFKSFARHPHHQSMTNRVFIRKHLLRQELANEHHPCALQNFLIRKIPAAKQRDAHCFEVLCVDKTKVIVESLIRRCWRATFDRIRPIVYVTPEWQM